MAAHTGKRMFPHKTRDSQTHQPLPESSNPAGYSRIPRNTLEQQVAFRSHGQLQLNTKSFWWGQQLEHERHTNMAASANNPFQARTFSLGGCSAAYY